MPSGAVDGDRGFQQKYDLKLRPLSKRPDIIKFHFSDVILVSGNQNGITILQKKKFVSTQTKLKLLLQVCSYIRNFGLKKIFFIKKNSKKSLK